MKHYIDLRTLRIRAAILVVVAALLCTFAWADNATPASAAVAAVSIFGNATPTTTADPDTAKVELGLQFKSAAAGQVSGVRFYKSAANKGTHTGMLRRGSTLIATGTFTGETAAGWQSMIFPAPVNITMGTIYTVSYLAPSGRYAADNPYTFPITTGDLTAIGSVYRYGGGYPTSVYQASNYWVDVLFVRGSPTTSPTMVSSTATSTLTSLPTTPTHPSSITTTTSTPAVEPTTSSPTPTVEPTTATPTTTTAPPSNSTKPGPSNTGVPAGTILTPYTGPQIITTAGTVIDSNDVTGSLIIRAKNVVIRNSKIHDDPSATAGIYVDDNGSATITDSEIYNFQVGIVYNNWTAIRVNMHDMTFDNIKMASNAALRDSWIHTPKPSGDAHWDGVQVQSGVTNTVIQGNFIDATGAGTNSALFLCPDLGPSTNGPLTVTGNWLDGGNYTVNVLDGANKTYYISNISVTNNRFGHGAWYGPTYVNVPVTWSGNVWDDTGTTVSY